MQEQNKELVAMMTSLLQKMTELSEENKSIKERLMDLEVSTKEQKSSNQIPSNDSGTWISEDKIEKVKQDEILKKTLNPRAVSAANIDRIRDKLDEVQTQQVFSAIQQIQKCNERIEVICTSVDPEFSKFGRKRKDSLKL